MSTLTGGMTNGIIDGKALAGLITELNIARRNYRSYPKGHPVIAASLNKVAGIYASLMTSHQVILIGVTRDSLIIDGVPLDKSNPIFRDFAKVLFERGIGALQLQPGLTTDELNRFAIILALKREDILRYGGIEPVWGKARINSLTIRPIRYDLFRTTEETSVSAEPMTRDSLWERFANALVQGEDIGADGFSGDSFDPQLLAEALNRYYSSNSSAFSASGSLNAVGNIIRQDSGIRTADSKDSDLEYRKLADFVKHLNPELRRQFLSSNFQSSPSGPNQHAEKLLSSLSSDMIISTLDDVNQNRLSIPPVVISLLNKLGSHADQQQLADSTSNLQDQDVRELDEFGNRMKTLFREQASEQFVPELYQAKLNKIMTSDQIRIVQREEIAELQDALNPKTIDNRISEIILQLLMIDSDDGNTGVLSDNLNSMCAYFLETGDYEQLLKIMDGSLDLRLPENFRNEIRSFFAQQSFIEEILIGLHTWGKSRFEQIKKVLDHIGEPFIEPMLDALAEESSMSLRRFMIDRLLGLGPLAGQAIIARLFDPRWYYLRNLVVALRTMNYTPAAESLRPLCLHADARVRLEAIKTLLHFRDPSIEQTILNDMESNEHSVQLEAIRMAEKSHSPAIADKLLSIVNRSGLSNSEYELKSAAVHSLGQLGQMEVLPEFGRILSSRNLLRPVLLSKLKVDIVRSLEYYPAAVAKTILARLAEGKDEVAIQAAATLNKMVAKKHE